MATGTKRRKAASGQRRPPKGFRTWKAYMASIRPGGKRKGKGAGGRKRTAKRRPVRNTNKGASVAVRRTGTRRRSVSRAARRGAVRVRRVARRVGRTRAAQELGPVAVQGVKDAVGVVAGKVVTRMASNAIGQAPGSMLGILAEGATAIAGGILLDKVSSDSARMFVAGGFAGVLERLAVRANLPYVGGYLSGDPMFEGLAAYPYDPPGGFLSADELVEAAAQLQAGGGDGMGAYELGDYAGVGAWDEASAY